MNDEIREILDKIQNVVNHKEASYNALIETKAEDYKQLLDYITNLQEENENTKEKAKNYLDIYEEMFDYKSRVEKAVDYIKNNISWYYDEDLDESIYQDVVNGDDLLNILQNGSENND